MRRMVERAQAQHTEMKGTVRKSERAVLGAPFGSMRLPPPPPKRGEEPF